MPSFTDQVVQFINDTFADTLASQISKNGVPSNITLNGSDESKEEVKKWICQVLDISKSEKKKTPKKGTIAGMSKEDFSAAIKNSPDKKLCAYIYNKGSCKDKHCGILVPPDECVGKKFSDIRCKDCLKKKQDYTNRYFSNDPDNSEISATLSPQFNTVSDEEKEGGGSKTNPIAAFVSGRRNSDESILSPSNAFKEDPKMIPLNDEDSIVDISGVKMIVRSDGDKKVVCGKFSSFDKDKKKEDFKTNYLKYLYELDGEDIDMIKHYKNFTYEYKGEGESNEDELDDLLATLDDDN